MKTELCLEWFKNRKVLITGHTGFKGAWLCRILVHVGANVMGYALEPLTNPSLFSMCDVEDKITSVIGDIRDREHLLKVFKDFQPEIVIHLAAQPIVRESYKNPAYTYETNVMGTVNLCEAVRLHSCVKSFLNVTTDKVYRNSEKKELYAEEEPLDGYDPYSNSKSCSELITHSYINSFYEDMGVCVSTARAGNVIGGGDFSCDRIIPDCVKSAREKRDIIVRNPHSVRPYQHVLEALAVYLLIVQKQYENSKYAGFYNVGPESADCLMTGQLVDLFCEKWGDGQAWIDKFDGGPYEVSLLKIDCAKLKSTFDWSARWSIDVAVEKTIEWFKVYFNGGNVVECMDEQIREFFCLKR